MKKKRKKYRTKYTPEYAVRMAVLAATGSNDKEISKSLGIKYETMWKWKKQIPLCKFALETARKTYKAEDPEAFENFALSRMSRGAKKAWEKIMFWQDADDSTERIGNIMMGLSTTMKQRMWVQAFIQGKFTKSSACRITGVPTSTLDKWMQTDSFRKLLDELTELKKDFFEEALVDLVAARDVGATIFVNRTKNRDRGYGEKLEVEGNINHNVEHSFSIDHLDLPLETRVELREAMEKYRLKQEEAKSLANRSAKALPAPIEVEAEEVEDR